MHTAAYGAVCAAWFCGNLVLRWGAFEFFQGHGAYGWSPAGPLGLAGMVLAVAGSAVTGFVLLPWAADALARWVGLPARSVGTVLKVAMVSALCLAEADANWFALSREHLRWSDVAIFFESDPAGHFGVTLDQSVRLVALTAMHIPAIAVLTSLAARVGRVTGLEWRTRAALPLAVALAAAGFAMSFAFVMQQSDQWAAIARRNFYDLSASRVAVYRHPDAAKLQDWFERAAVPPGNAADAATARSAAAPPALPRAEKIVVIAIEGWNTRLFDVATMPRMASLASRCQVAARHFSSGNNTLLGITGLAYGISPAFFFEQVADGVTNPALERFSAAGFAAARFGHGLTSYRRIEGYLEALPPGGEAEVPAEQSIRQILDHLERHPRAIAFYYYGDTHFPYLHAPSYAAFTPEATPEETIAGAKDAARTLAIVNRYRNALAEADARLKVLLDQLDLTRTTLVVTGDHGESMMENGRLSHSSSLETPQIATPLILCHPGLPAGRIDAVTSHLDVMPTLLELAGLPATSGLQGSSLLEPAADRRALVVHNRQNSRPTRMAVVAPDHKVVLDATDIRRPAIVDLLGPDDRAIRLQALQAASVKRSLAHAADLFRWAGCLAGGPQGLPQRHCRDPVSQARL